MAHKLRFISGKYQGGEVILPNDGEIMIGRANDLGIVLVEDLISRHHARISVKSGVVELEDLGSTNGTFLNGEKVSHARLVNGDRVLVGSNIIQVILDGSTPFTQPKELEDVISTRRTVQIKAMSGSISEISLTDLIQLLSGSKKTGTLTIFTEKHEGKIHIEEGRVFAATIDHHKGISSMKCFTRIVSWEEGTFEVGPLELQSVEDPIAMPTEMLLMEAMRQMDELNRIAESLPPMSSAVTLNAPASSDLKELSSDELDLLQIVHNHGHVETILNLSPHADAKTGELLANLIQKGYLKMLQ